MTARRHESIHLNTYPSVEAREVTVRKGAWRNAAKDV